MHPSRRYAILSPYEVGPGVATTVMSLGDSITLGSPGHATGGESYRTEAGDFCDTYGYPVTWVGPEKDASQTYYHLGMSGHYVYEIEDEVDDHIDDNLADVVIVCGGTNDLLLGNAPATVETAMEKCIDTILVLPGVKHVILTDVPVQPADEADCIAYNSLLETLAGTYEDVTYAAIFAGVELDDGVHPTEAGYAEAGETLGPILYTVLAGLSDEDVARSPAQLSSRQQYAATAIRDFWISVYNEAGDGLGDLHEVELGTNPVEDGDEIAKAIDLINSGEWKTLVTGPTYDADGASNGEPVMDFTVSSGAVGLRKSTHTFGSPCSVWIVGEFFADSYGYAIARGVGGSQIVMFCSETFGATEDGIGFYTSADGHTSFAGNDGTDHTGEFAFWCIVFDGTPEATLYKNGVQEGSAQAYTTFSPASSNLDLGYNATPLMKAPDIGAVMRALSAAEIAALNTFFASRYSIGS